MVNIRNIKKAALIFHIFVHAFFRTYKTTPERTQL
jgi:hypothetical protein